MIGHQIWLTIVEPASQLHQPMKVDNFLHANHCQFFNLSICLIEKVAFIVGNEQVCTGAIL